MKYYYSDVKGMEKYISIGTLFDLGYIVVSSDSLLDEIKESFEKLYFDRFVTGNHAIYLYYEILIKKDSDVGNFIINHPELFLNKSMEITYKKITNAYLTAVYDDNSKMANKILPLLKGKICGMKEDLSSKYCESVLDYILNSDDFEEHVFGVNSDKKEKYLLYENGQYSVISGDKKGITKVKKIEVSSK